MAQVEIAGGKRFDVNEGQTVLEAALVAGVVLEHSCKTGRCGVCKTRVAHGATTVIGSETALTRAELDAGWILSCARGADTDVRLEVEDLSAFGLTPAKTLPARIDTLERLSEDVIELALRLPPNQRFTYHPGQYFDLIGPAAVRRSYSAAGAGADGRIRLQVRRVDAGVMSAYLFDQARANDLVRLNGPLGTFFLRDVAGLDLVFLATGTGIAPVKAMLEGMAEWEPARLPRSIRLYWGGRVEADLYWNPASAAVALNYHPVLSRADAIWSGRRGHVQAALLADGFDPATSAVYACGSAAMVAAAGAALIAAGLAPCAFLSDAFVPSAPL